MDVVDIVLFLFSRLVSPTLLFISTCIPEFYDLEHFVPYIEMFR